MGVNISIKDCTIQDEARVLNNAKIAHATQIELEDLKIAGKAVLLEGLDIPDLCSAIEKESCRMNAAENNSMRKVLALKDQSTKSFLTALAKHLQSFAEGVAASVAASMLYKLMI